jgi:sugar/nucleoside kinase (ribokinase family)
MKIAVLGPVTKDFITIDGKLSVQIGGIPYYVALALKNLGTETIVPFVTAGREDRGWVSENFGGLAVRQIDVEKTLESMIEYSSSNPDMRKSFIHCYPNTIEPAAKLLEELEGFDHIIFGPLFHDNTPFELFNKLKHKNLTYGNFGLFTYGEAGKFVKKNPENLIRVLPFLKYLFLDRGEAEFVSGQVGVKEPGNFFLSQGLANMIITEGSKGSHLFIGADYFKIPAFTPMRLVDTTGAGDTYLAAFIRATELFMEPEQQGRFAAMVATMSLEKGGAFDSNLTTVLNRLKE